MGLTKVSPAIESSHGRKNAIINGDFNIWQRGTNIVVDISPTYTADRWVCFTPSPTLTGTVSKISDNPNGLTLQKDNGSSENSILVLSTIIESINMAHFAGESVTLSGELKVGADFSGVGNVITIEIRTGTVADEGAAGALAGSWTGYQLSIKQITTTNQNWTTFDFTTIIPSDALELAIIIKYTTSGTAGADDSINVRNIQLEKGTVATEFEYRSIGEELSLCQRYYYARSAGFVIRNSVINYYVQNYMNLPIIMRTTPTVSFIETVGGGVTVANVDVSPEIDYIRFSAQFTSISTTGRLSYTAITADAEL